MTVEMERIQAGSFCGIDTHEWPIFNQLLPAVNWRQSSIVVDPFARNCNLGPNHISNDINPDTDAKWSMDADDFLAMCLDAEWNGEPLIGRVDLVIFDPPFSAHQAERKYGEGANLYAEPGRIQSMMSKIGRLVRPGGHVLKFGYNSTQHHKGWRLRGLYLLNFGGNRNDVIVTLWQNTQYTLDSY